MSGFVIILHQLKCLVIECIVSYIPNFIFNSLTPNKVYIHFWPCLLPVRKRIYTSMASAYNNMSSCTVECVQSDLVLLLMVTVTYSDSGSKFSEGFLRLGEGVMVSVYGVLEVRWSQDKTNLWYQVSGGMYLKYSWG